VGADMTAPTTAITRIISSPHFDIAPVRLADVIADAVGITKESAQLHLKTIRAADEITFKGYAARPRR
jgi:hypothetical protein